MSRTWLDLLDVRLKEDAALSKLYDVKGPVKHGAQAGCTQVVHRETGVHYAMREYANEDLVPWKLEQLRAAVAAQRKLADAPEDEDLRCLTRLHEVLGSPKRTLVVGELAPTEGAICTDLFTLVEERGRFSEQDARQIFTRLVLAVKAAHQNGIVLRNIKPEGVQVRQRGAGAEWEVWLADLHCAAKASEGEEDACLSGLHGTPEYCAPEVVIWYWHECEPQQLPEPPPLYGVQADAWALGITLHVMLCGCFPFEPSDDVDALLRSINAAEFSFGDSSWKKLSEDALDLVSSLLKRDPEDRLYVEEVLQHPFCAGVVNEQARPVPWNHKLSDPFFAPVVLAPHIRPAVMRRLRPQPRGSSRASTRHSTPSTMTMNRVYLGVWA